MFVSSVSSFSYVVLVAAKRDIHFVIAYDEVTGHNGINKIMQLALTALFY